jgi:hypothetical protein
LAAYIKIKHSKLHGERKKKKIQEITSKYSKKLYRHLMPKKGTRDKRKLKAYTDTHLQGRYQHERSEVGEKTNAELLLEYIERSGDFPDTEFTENVKRASQEFRRNFKLHATNG